MYGIGIGFEKEAHKNSKYFIFSEFSVYLEHKKEPLLEINNGSIRMRVIKVHNFIVLI